MPHVKGYGGVNCLLVRSLAQATGTSLVTKLAFGLKKNSDKLDRYFDVCQSRGELGASTPVKNELLFFLVCFICSPFKKK